MASNKTNVSLRPMRVFSDELKRKLVKDIEKGKVSVAGVSREYAVSLRAVYNWLAKFSSSLSPSKVLVIQMDSEQYKTKELQQKVLQLEAALGRKQLELDILNKLIETASQDLGIDLKKNTSGSVLNGSDKTNKDFT